MLLATCLAALHVPLNPGNDSWPGWRGATGSGVAAGSPPVAWNEKENVRWKTPIPGKGLSQPVIWEGLVFVTSAVGTGKKAESVPEPEGGDERERRDGDGRRGDGERGDGERGDGERSRDGGSRGGQGRDGQGRGAPIEEQDFVVLALDRKTGAVRWQTKLSTAMPHEGTHPDGSYASPTPVTDGERVYVSFGSYGIHALDLAGKVLWSVDLGDMRINNAFGEGISPVLYGDLLIQGWDHEGDSFLVALEKASGKERWRTARPAGTSWCTPVVVSVGGATQLVVAGPRTTAYDPATGAELWHDGEANGRGAIASPVVLDELIVFASGGRGGGEARALVAHGSGSEGSETVLWKQRVDAPHVPSPLALDGRVYLLKQDSGMLSVLDPATGSLLYGPERLEGVADVYASLIAAGGRIYVAGRDGTVEVLSAWPVETVSVNRLEDGFDASPAVAGDELFLRGKAHLYCIAGS